MSRQFLKGIVSDWVTVKDDPLLPTDASNKKYVDLVASRVDWWMLIGGSKYQNSTTTIPSGVVLVYVFSRENAVIYRHISNSKTGLYPTEDAFYLGFNGTTLTNRLVGR